MGVVLLLTSVLLVGCGMAGAASQIVSSAVVPMVLLASMVAFLVGCGGPRFSGGQPTQGPVSATPTPQLQATALRFITQPAKDSARKSEAFVALTPAPQVAVVDQNGSTITTATDAITVSLDKNPSNAVLSGTLTVNAVNGVATFADLHLSVAAAGYTLKATSGTLTADTSVAFTVTPLVPDFTTPRLSRTDYPNGIPVSASLTAQAAGDLNQDGYPDLVYACTAAVVHVMLNDKSGGFSAPVQIETGVTLTDIAIADLNKDGKSDLLLSDGNDTLVQVLLGNGDGTFTAPVNYTLTNSAPQSLAVADFNGDGKLDLAASLAGSPNGTIAVLLGNANGSGTLNPPQYFGTVASGLKLTAVHNPSAPQAVDLVVTEGDGKAHYFGNNGSAQFGELGATAVTANALYGRAPQQGQSIFAADSTGLAYSLLYNTNGTYNTPTLLPMSGIA
ncbi:MAG: VCBS repeat-containing protein, partial [Proteobacteria bacterium]|nr:VCBS repeat-containing protein [Pseudomonadota bacterium]